MAKISPEKRWMAVGPYYAMFPLSFAFETIRQYSEEGDGVLDPFAGRASSIFAAYCLGRYGTGIELSPVGWLYGKVKLGPARLDDVTSRLEAIGNNINQEDRIEAESLPEFFRHCFSQRVLHFLVKARRELNWRHNQTDATLMAILLIDLHGKKGSAISNQMRQGKAMSPDYSVAWWKQRELTPPDLDPIAFVNKKLAWRYKYGSPDFDQNSVIFGDSRTELLRLKSQPTKYKLLFTSPPYFGITNYFYDQWLRLWMLGGTAKPSYTYDGARGPKYDSRQGYKDLLTTVFSLCKPLLHNDATIYVRTDARKFTKETTLQVLTEIFPEKMLQEESRPVDKPTQTDLFNNGGDAPGEHDIILN